MMSVVVIDNAIPVEHQLVLERLCLSDGFGWIFNPTTAYSKQDLDNYNFSPEFFNNTVDTPLFSHLLWTEYGRNSNFFNNFAPVVDAIPYQCDRLLRFKINLTLPSKDNTADTYSVPHVDYFKEKFKIVTAIYYINDSDGDTVIFNEQPGQLGPLTVKQRITPKRGRLVVFDSNHYHSGNNPSTNVPRLVGNINIAVKQESILQ
jgi:hypothetical protein